MRLPQLLILVLCLWSASGSLAQTRSESPEELNILDPETLYSFTGANGEGFIRRSPLNLPQPMYVGQATGLVPLRFTIVPKGTVKDVRLAPPLLPGTSRDMVNAAVKAVEQWEFEALPANFPQEDMPVQVVIQYNKPGSGVLYASDGSCIVKGLGDRKPAHIYKPGLPGPVSGIVNAVVGLRPDGTVRGVYRYFGEAGEEEIPPRLGILTYEAITDWTFHPAPPAPPVEEGEIPLPQDLEITVTLRFVASEEPNLE